MRKSTSGFTIVELLIVIVIIAILAAISIVAYNGFQNRSYDSSVSSDLAGFAKKIELSRIDNPSESYPVSNSDLPVLKVNKSAYDASGGYNLLYCVPSSSSPKEYMILVTSKSGNQFSVRNGGGVTRNTGAPWTIYSTNACSSQQSGWLANAAGYNSSDTSTGPWRAWAGGN